MASLSTVLSVEDIEKFRVQELLRYFSPTVYDAASSTTTPESCPAVPVLDSFQSEEVSVIKLAHDPVLTAFAQLGALRTNCDRSFISLIDHKTQYIVAEATKTVSLLSPDIHGEGDRLYLGAQAMEKSWGLCPQTIQVFSSQDGSLDEQSENISANANLYVIRDVAQDQRFVTRPYVAEWPYMRYYAEVPIRTSAGHTIGSYCVVDNKSRPGEDDYIVGCLQEVALAIMNHLELVKSQQDHKRAERMIKGLGLFVEGRSSLRDWYMANPQKQDSSAGEHSQRTMTMAERAHVEFGPQHALKSASMNSNLKGSWPATTVSEIREGALSGIPSFAAELKADSEVIVESLIAAAASTEHDSGVSTQVSTATVMVDGDVAPPADETPTSQKYSAAQVIQSQELLAFHGREDLFSRASNLIREALGVDGAVFLDASLSDNDTDKFINSDRSSAPDQSVDQVEVLEIETYAQPEPEPSCSVLGFSTRDSSSLSGLEAVTPFDGMSQASLRYLLSQHPRGYVVNYHDRDISGSSADAGPSAIAVRDLRKLFPELSSLALYPLWDADKQRWYAVCIVWSTEESQQPQMPGHLTYLASFGNSVMAEKTRFDTLISERAKSDFISSISHELRSPLHGVLACSAFLEESSRNPADADLIRTIQVCSNTLLDTMDHLLEFSKVNRSVDNDLRKVRAGLKKDSEHSALVKTDLRVLIEDVVEAALVGRAYTAMPGLAHEEPPALRRSETQSSLDSFGITSSSIDHITMMKTHGSLIIMLTVEWLPTWTFEIPVGAWKRILLNLFGNSLKYTSSGYIEVSLSFAELPDDPTAAPQVEATLTVTDSGKGISEDFLNNNLFMPFLQEDPLAPGTGLGLSIVKQIVKSLKGTIAVESERGFGTTVTIKAPLDVPPPEVSLELLHMNPFAPIQDKTDGQKLSLIAAEVYPDSADFSHGSAEARSMIVLRKGLSLLASTWFGMEVVIVPSSTLAEDGICVLTEATFRRSYELGLREPSVERQVLIVLTSNDCITQHSFPGTGPGICFLSQPIGPRKLGSVLSQALDYLETLNKDTNPKRQSLASIRESEEVETPPASLSQNTLLSLETATPRGFALQPMSPAPSDSDMRSELSLPQSTTSNSERASSMLIQAPALKPRRVLLVEDNPINLKILVTSLEKLKITYGTAINGLEALRLYEEKEGDFDVIVTDISMPVMDGLTSTRKIRAYEKHNSISSAKIIALTGLSSDDVREEAMLSGVDSFLTKPASIKKLQQLLMPTV